MPRAEPLGPQPSVFLPPAAAATLAFMSSLSLSQTLQLHLGIHTGSRWLGLRVLPNLLGGVTVAAGSLAALWASDATSTTFGHAVSHDKSPQSPVLLGAACFLACGGRFWALSPSSLSTLGAFARTARASLPATLKYATSTERATIQQLGRRFGCHTCGARLLSSNGRFNADHMPPLSEVKRANSALWRRLLSRPMRQRFYPQCTDCSNLQGALLSERSSLINKFGNVRLAARATTAVAAVRPRFTSLRPYHGVGGVLSGFKVAADQGMALDAFDAVDKASQRCMAEMCVLLLPRLCRAGASMGTRSDTIKDSGEVQEGGVQAAGPST